jgi:hypothetical protein
METFIQQRVDKIIGQISGWNVCASRDAADADVSSLTKDEC